MRCHNIVDSPESKVVLDEIGKDPAAFLSRAKILKVYPVLWETDVSENF